MFARVTRGQPGEIRLDRDTVPDAATVTLTRADGTAVVTDADAAIGAGMVTYEMTGATVATLGLLTATWTVTEGAETDTATTLVEVVGGRLVSLAELRAVPGLEGMDDAELERGRLLGETALEDAAGVAFTPRATPLRLDGPGGCNLFLPGVPMLRAVIAARVYGEALTADELADLVVYEEEGVVYRPEGWPVGRRSVVLEVEHGFAVAPPRVTQAVKALARHALVDSPLDDRTISASNEDGTVQVMVQAGVRGAVFALPEANAALAQYGFVEVG